MSGRVVHTPDPGHHCNPGCTYHTITEADVDPAKRLSAEQQQPEPLSCGCTHDAHAEQLRRLQHTMRRP